MIRLVLVCCLLSAAASHSAAAIAPERVRENLRKAREQAAAELVLEIVSVRDRADAAPGARGLCVSARVLSVKINEKNARAEEKKAARRRGETVPISLDCVSEGTPPAPGVVRMGTCAEVKPGRRIKAWSRSADFPSRRGGGCPAADLGVEFHDGKEADMEKTVYDFTVKDARGADYPLSELKGKVALIVNVASNCGFTPQYEGLEALYKKYAGRGFTVLGFPCNQFGGQEPGSNEQIQKFCSLNYGVTFPVMGKIDVNGEGADPLYGHLKAKAPGVLGSEAIKWNFTKFLVGRDGRVIARYAPQAEPAGIAPDIEKALGPEGR